MHSIHLPQPIQKALEQLGFTQLTPIQEKSIPLALEGKDLIACAQTGSGKTLAFGIPTLCNLLQNQNKTGLVLAPTRELALQIEATWKKLTRFIPTHQAVVLMGGASMSTQIRALMKKPRLIIATPGRLLDHLQRKTLNLQQTAVLVLDEADRMLDMGFEPQLKRILSYLTTARQTLLFSATWENRLDQLSKKYLRQPVRIAVGNISQAAPTIDQSTLSVVANAKNEKLLDELNQRAGSVLVFVKTQARTERVTRYLSSYGVDVCQIHGGRTQGQRKSALLAFREGRMRVLVATDIAARGLDILNINHVINYDLPQSPEDYIHRIGRTGRAGASGQAISFVTPEDRKQWGEILTLLRKSGSNIPKSF